MLPHVLGPSAARCACLAELHARCGVLLPVFNHPYVVKVATNHVRCQPCLCDVSTGSQRVREDTAAANYHHALNARAGSREGSCARSSELE
jgi:hypothetical protein